MGRPCASGSEAHSKAHRDLEVIDRQVAGLDRSDDPMPVLVRLTELSKSTCFDVIGGTSLEPNSANGIENGQVPDTGWSLQEFWRSGGREAILSSLDLAARKEHGGTFSISPRFLRTLSRESRANHPLAPLLCSIRDSACHDSTRAWRLRAEMRFELTAAISRAETRTVEQDAGEPHAQKDFGFEACERRALASTRYRFGGWLDCLRDEAWRERVVTFPLGGISKPLCGWLVVTGQRGHPGGCVEHRAYHLETGTAYIARDCDEASYVEEGSVAYRSAEAGRRVTGEIGELPVAYLQEATWFLLMSPELGEFEHPMGHAIPASLEPWMDEEPVTARGHMWSAMVWDSSSTTLRWSYVRGEQVMGRGELTWPGETGIAVNDYAVELLRVAESAMKPSCPRARLPRLLQSGGPDLRASGPEAATNHKNHPLTGILGAWSVINGRQLCGAS